MKKAKIVFELGIEIMVAHIIINTDTQKLIAYQENQQFFYDLSAVKRIVFIETVTN